MKDLRFNYMTVQEYKDKNLCISYSIFNSKFGLCLVGSTSKGICTIAFGDSKKEVIKDLKKRFPYSTCREESHDWHNNVESYLNTNELHSPIAFYVFGTPFQIKVWNALLKISAGKTGTYLKIAEYVGGKNYSRAVGTAIGLNPIGYIIPCHRVLQTNGGLGGFRWGIDRKKAMLLYEGITV